MVREKLAAGYSNGQWQPKGGYYTIEDGYKWLRQDNSPKVTWFNIVWSKLNTPKHAFNAWLIRHGRLLTLDRLSKMGITDQSTCYLCGLQDEDHDHLFRKCIYTCICYARLQSWLGIQGSGFGSAEQMLKLRHCSGFLRKLLCSLVVATHYHIWHARNICRVEQRVLHPKLIIQAVLEDGRLALLKYKYFQISQHDREWCNLRGLM
ncbi:uncharacterized protein LOC141629957 [Silene latifolia]|uniref:uncharacterized protein LOC141629957 n=1 Tax=Silene latifolia TaxID=37657 RepID=UPI003D780375